MAKVQKISKNITSFAGIYFVNDEFSRSGLRRLIDNQLGNRASALVAGCETSGKIG